MIPETGTREDFKLVVMRCVTSAPLPGERYFIEDAAKIMASNGPMGSVTILVTHICGDVHYMIEDGPGEGRHCLVFGSKWRGWRDAGLLKFIGYASGIFWL